MDLKTGTLFWPQVASKLPRCESLHHDVDCDVAVLGAGVLAVSSGTASATPVITPNSSVTNLATWSPVTIDLAYGSASYDIPEFYDNAGSTAGDFGAAPSIVVTATNRNREPPNFSSRKRPCAIRVLRVNSTASSFR